MATNHILIPDHLSNVGHSVVADSKTVIPAPVCDVGHGAMATDYKTAETKKNVAVAQMEYNRTKVCLKHDNMVVIYQIFKYSCGNDCFLQKVLFVL